MKENGNQYLSDMITFTTDNRKIVSDNTGNLKSKYMKFMVTTNKIQ